jgi:hypothetical protein
MNLYSRQRPRASPLRRHPGVRVVLYTGEGQSGGAEFSFGKITELLCVRALQLGEPMALYMCRVDGFS